MNTTIVSAIKQLSKVSQVELSELKEWLVHIEPYMFDSVSTYAKGRKELHLRNFVKLASSKDKTTTDIVKPIASAIAEKYQSHKIEEIGDRLLPGFHQGLVLYYPKDTLIKPHRDSPAYAKGAASINIVGNAKFLISNNQDAANMQTTLLGEGDCIWFDNKQLHAVAKVEQDRWCVCFFYLKEEYLPKPEQLGLFPTIQTTESNYPDKKIEPSRQQNQAVQISPKLPITNYNFPNPRYTWTDAPGWWSPHGEEIAWAEHPLTKEKRHGIKAVKDIPDGWGAVLDYGGRVIPIKDLRLISA